MMENKFVGIVVLVVQVIVIKGYSIPDVTVQALKNGEFRVYIPDSKGIREFTPHVKINERLAIQDPGDFFSEIREKTSDFWIAKFSGSNIKVGDTIYLWVSVIVSNFSYRKEGISIIIKELYDNYPVLKSKCVVSSTVFDGGKQSCIGNVILNEEFQGPLIDSSKWIVEHWIPTYSSPYYIFNSYENREDTRFIKDSVLYLKPISLKTNEDLRGNLDLTKGCTAYFESECFLKSRSWNVLPPVKAAKIKSLLSFKYGKIDIKAKLPAGDWIFPVIQLEQKVKENRESSPKVLIAYSRGNEVLMGNNQHDIGSKMLFGGPVQNPNEPERSKNLVSKRAPNPFYSDFHVYSLLWEPGKMTFRVDDVNYGSVETSSKQLIDDIDIRAGSAGAQDSFNKEYVVTLGVGVGGLVDFPDGYTSGGVQKPWLNTEPKFVTKFFDRKSDWGSTWKADKVALQIDYVKVTAI